MPEVQVKPDSDTAAARTAKDAIYAAREKVRASSDHVVCNGLLPFGWSTGPVKCSSVHAIIHITAIQRV